MKKIYLVRHGQDEDNAAGVLNGHRDRPLTELGKEQAKALVKKIKESDLKIEKIYSSPLKRARDTALIVADSLLHQEPEKLDLLIERDFGIMAGKPISSILELAPENLIKTNPVNYFLDVEGVEKFPDLFRRAGKLLSWLEKNDEHRNILLVCHGDFGKMIYGAFYNLSWQEALAGFHFGNSDIILLEKGLKNGERIIYQTKQVNV